MMDRISNYAIASLIAACAAGAVLAYSPGILTSRTPLGHDGHAPPTPTVVAIVPVPVIPRESHSVAWFKAHTPERKETNAWCREHPSVAMRGEAGCQEADTAEMQLQSDAWLAKAKAATGGKW